MPNFNDITQAYAGAVGRFNSATQATITLRRLLQPFRESIEHELSAPAGTFSFFPIREDPTKRYFDSPTLLHFDGQNSWEVGLAITITDAPSVTCHIIFDVRDGQFFARIAPDGEPYQVKKQENVLANKLAELAIERLNGELINPDAKKTYSVEIKQGQETSAT